MFVGNFEPNMDAEDLYVREHTNAGYKPLPPYISPPPSLVGFFPARRGNETDEWWIVLLLHCKENLLSYLNWYFHSVQGESSNTQPSKDQNLVYFKEVNFDPSVTGLENTTAPNLPPPQQADVESETSQNPPLEGGREPETSFSTSRPETHEQENIQPSYAGVNEIKETPSSSPEGLTEPAPTVNNADVGSAGLNERPSSEISEAIKKLSSSEPENGNTEAAPLYEGSEINSMSLRPHKTLGSELSDLKLNPSYASSSPTEAKPRPGKEKSSSTKEASSYERQQEKDAKLEAFAKLAMNDEMPTKSNEPPSVTYVAPENAKVPAKKPASTPIKLPPAIALITPKRGINIFSMYSP